ncbi:MAG: glutamine synthetase family protein, partial [Pseudomonadota bacterium]
GAYSQFELDFGYTDVVGMADRLTFLRVLLKEVAKHHGFFVTYMPKFTIGDWRSGAHINFSVQDAATGRNLFGDKADGWSDEAYHAVGGLLRHGGGLTAITCSTVNSYKGLVARVPGFEGGVFTWAPTHMTYGPNNRSAMLRLPQSRFCVENRAADMCMNAYLALAGTTAATVKGLVEKLDAGPPLGRDLYLMTEAEFAELGIQRLPRSLGDAIALMQADDLMKDVMGDGMHKSYCEYKQDEWDRYNVAITDWEIEEYLRLY